MKRKKQTPQPFAKKKTPSVFSKVGGIFFTNVGAKIAIFILAVILWLYTVLQNEYTYVFDVPLDLVNIQAGKTLREKVPESVQGEFTGKGFSLLPLIYSPKSTFKFVIDLQRINWSWGYAIKPYFLEEHPEKVILPRNVNATLTQVIWPDTIWVELDPLMTRKIPVIPQVDISTEAGFTTVGNVSVVPDSITVSGPRYYVRSYTSVKTEPVIYRGQAVNLEQSIRLERPYHSMVKFSHSEVKLAQDIELISEAVIDNIPVKIIGSPGSGRIVVSPSVVSLTVTAGVEVLRNLKPSDFDVSFNFYKQWRSGISYYIPEIKTPDNIIDVLQVSPRNIEVRIVKERNN